MKDPQDTELSYRAAMNLRRAVMIADKIGQAVKLIDKADDHAATYRIAKHLPLTHPTGGEDKKASNMFHILRLNVACSKFQYKHGPDATVPDFMR